MMNTNSKNIGKWIFFEMLQYVRFLVFGFPAAVATFMLLLGTFAGVLFYFQEINPQGLESIGQIFLFIESTLNISIPEHFTDEDLFKLYLPITTAIFVLVEILRRLIPEKFNMNFKQKLKIQFAFGLILVFINVTLFSMAFSDEDVIKLASFLAFFFILVLLLSLFYTTASHYANKGILWLKDNWQ